jgi:hypothetical protein
MGQLFARQMKDAFGDLHNGAVYKSDFLHYKQFIMSYLRMYLRFMHQAIWRGHMVKTLVIVLRGKANCNWFALP